MGRRRQHIGRRAGGRPGPRAGAARRLLGGRRPGRVHDRRRPRVAGSQVRAGLRQRPLVRGRHARRLARPGLPHREPRALPGAVRGRRRLRRRDRHGDRARSGHRRVRREPVLPGGGGRRGRGPVVGVGRRCTRRADVGRRADERGPIVGAARRAQRTLVHDRAGLLVRTTRGRPGAPRRVAGGDAADHRRLGRDAVRRGPPHQRGPGGPDAVRRLRWMARAASGPRSAPSSPPTRSRPVVRRR